MKENKSVDELILRVVEAEIELEEYADNDDKEGMALALEAVMSNCRKLRKYYLSNKESD